MQHWHTSEVDAVAAHHGVDLALGLAAHEVARRVAVHGPNELPTTRRQTPLALLAAQFTDVMVLVLLAAAAVSLLIGEAADALVIGIIVVLNAAIGFAQAWRADRALDALQQLAVARATVLRDGGPTQVPAQALVPGDVVLLEAGNQVPADLRLVHAAQLQVDESALTGESASVAKHSAALPVQEVPLAERTNMAFKGTLATQGRASGIVVATGAGTELGRIARLLDTVERSTPLQRRLAVFGRWLAAAVVAICGVILALGLARGEPPLAMLMTALSLAVAAIPEALPAVVTVLLALGARRMVAVKALVRRLASVETLGSVSTICTDKTGTLTLNRMQVECVRAGGTDWRPGAGAAPPLHAQALRVAALCNDAAAEGDGWRGDPTETALLAAAAAAGLPKAALDADAPRVAEWPFDSDRKRMSTWHRTPAGTLACVKGAPESVLPRCSAQWSPTGPQPLAMAERLAEAQALAADGLRVLALAQRDDPPPAASADQAESALQFIGLVALIDPPRPEAAAAVRDCLAAGITPVMVTGDHPATALAIARRLGIAQGGADEVISGPELAALDDAALAARVQRLRVVARVDPAQKIRIVQALQASGRFVAMTGDGVNDAPALKQADIGVAMGQGGTDVAREAASLVLLDDHFATIVAAVREGRRIYDNIRKFVRYAMTGNSGEIWTIFLAPLAGLPIPLLPIHILWVNLVTDGLPGLALAAEPAEPGVMRRPPRPPQETLFAGGMVAHILAIGLLMAVLCLGLQAWALAHVPAAAQTMVFTTLTFAQMAHVWAIRSESVPLARLGAATNRPLALAVAVTLALQLAVVYVPPLAAIFRTVPLGPLELALCAAAAAVVALAAEADKARRRRPAAAESPAS